MPRVQPQFAYSKISTKSQTVLPAEVRERLAIAPGDRLRYVIGDEGIRIEKAVEQADDPFASFTEWASPEDDESFADL
jgi:antitoxin PrlF